MRRSRKTDGSYDTRRRRWVTGCGDVVRFIHDPAQCAGRPCVIHNPSDHAMRGFPTHFRMPMPWDIKGPHTERICPHGVGHPDPDDYEYWLSRGQNYGVHGCDGCCRPDTAEQCGEVCAAGGGDVAVCQREKGHPPGECSSGKADEMARDMFAGMLPEWT